MQKQTDGQSETHMHARTQRQTCTEADIETETYMLRQTCKRRGPCTQRHMWRQMHTERGARTQGQWAHAETDAQMQRCAETETYTWTLKLRDRHQDIHTHMQHRDTCRDTLIKEHTVQ